MERKGRGATPGVQMLPVPLCTLEPTPQPGSAPLCPQLLPCLTSLGFALSPQTQDLGSLVKALKCLDEPPLALPKQGWSLFHSPETAWVGLAPSASNAGLASFLSQRKCLIYLLKDPKTGQMSLVPPKPRPQSLFRGHEGAWPRLTMGGPILIPKTPHNSGLFSPSWVWSFQSLEMGPETGNLVPELPL